MSKGYFMKFFQVVGILCIALLSAGSAWSQVSEGGTPVSFNKSLAAGLVADIPTEIMGSIDVEAYLAEDARDQAQGGVPFRFGAPFDVNYSLDNSGIWEELPDGGRLWRLRIECPGAYSINMIYDDYDLPEGARLFIYNENRDFVIGAFTDTNNKEHGMFATQPVKGDVSIIEYYEPADVRGRGKITISRIVHAYKDIFSYFAEKGYGSSGSCNNNVNCPEGDDWQDDKRGVAMVLLGDGTRYCSGSMINNVRQDNTQYFLTANHCLNGEENWIIMFNYESPTCTNSNGPTTQTVQGTVLRANYSTSDFALVELLEAIPQSYGIYYNGWSAEDVATSNSVAIHHPSGDIKKISFDYDAVTSTEYLGTTPGTTHWRIGQWEDGTTEGGSSGSPLFNPDHQIIGQLHGGYASCTSITSDWYGKIARSWLGGGSSSNQLKYWLDPDNTGAMSLDGWDPYGGTTITHVPLEDTRDTVTDYTVTAEIISAVASLQTSSLLLHYNTGSIWIVEQLFPTGNPDEYSADIPAQSSGTTIDYYLTASDDEGNADTTDTFNFFIEYSPEIAVAPYTIDETVNKGDTGNAAFYITNSGTGDLLYDISVIPDLNKYAAFGDLLDRGEVEPAGRFYSPEFTDYIDAKGSIEHPAGYPVDKDAGGPNGYGYFWMDSDEANGPTFNWIDISATGIDVSAGLDDDNFIGPYAIGFDFPYNGDFYSEFYIGSNGIIGFDTAQMRSRSKEPIPTAAIPNNFIAWLWDDLNITDSDNPGGAVYYHSDGSRLIIQFVDYPEYRADPGDVVTAEVFLDADGSITFQYLDIAAGFDTQNCTVGIEDSTGADGLEVAYLTSYLKNNLAVKFFMPYQWLILDTYSGSVHAGATDTVSCQLLTDELEAGTHTATILINSNDVDGGNSEDILVSVEVVDGPQYICGDANTDDDVNIADAVYVINYAFKGGPAPVPVEAGDANCDGSADVGDAVYLVNYVFNGGDPPCFNCP